MKKSIFIFFGMLFLFLGMLFYGKKVSNNSFDYLKETNLQLSGKVINLVKLRQGHDYGVLKVDVEKTSISYYDERGKREKYFGVIKGNKAEIIVTFISIIEINDKIVIDGTNFKVIRNDKIIRDNSWDLPFDIITNPFREISKYLKL